MKKYLLNLTLLACLSHINSAIAQKEDKITVMSKITCECIDNISDQVWNDNPKKEIDDCFNAAVLGGLLSMISPDETKESDSIVVELGTNKVKNGASEIDNIGQVDLELTKKQLRKDCERYRDFENKYSKDGDVEKISDRACECIDEIELGTEKKEINDNINSCITEAIVSNQVQNNLIGQLTKALEDIDASKKGTDSLVVTSDKGVVISANKDYAKIEEYLLRNCQSLKVLISSDNTRHENSMSNHDKALEFYNDGVDYFRNGNYKKALPKFKKAVKFDKEFAFAWDNLGVCQRKLGRYKEAINSYNESLKLDPLGRVPLMNIPVAYELLKDYDNAILAYERFSDLYPDDAEDYYGIGRMYHMKGNYKDALDSMFKAYLKYKEMKSPYVQDAERNISIFYNEMKEKGMLDVFNELAKKHNITIN